ncbi:hypothetical protein SSPIM334S_08353 [Streptomyces spiroverticillatus]
MEDVWTVVVWVAAFHAVGFLLAMAFLKVQRFRVRRRG